MAMNPRITTEKIRTDYQDYLSSILTVRDDEITRQAQEQVRRGQFVKGPYLETTLPFVNGKSLKDLVEEGLLSREFARVGGALHYSDWKLRSHQETALRKCVGEGRNIIVSTGTGSGKTECYLYPVLDAIMKEKEAGTLGPGVRALLLFPMNALANDQQKKLRKLLHDYPDITFGRYTGETPHKEAKETIAEAEQRLHGLYDTEHTGDTDPLLRKSIPNEYMTREAMIAAPPHILLTNYAMLEYMLLRPDTAPFFDTEFASSWQFLVLDEAHSYKGATGTEIAFLLRRLKERIRVHMHRNFRCIATSATLGSDNAKEGLAQFAVKLFDEPFTAEDVITARRVHPEVPPQSQQYSPDFYARLNNETCDLPDEERGARLYNVLRQDIRLYRLYDALQGAPKTLRNVAERVFPEIVDRNAAENALINMVEMAAAARPNPDDAALLPARYHLFLKSLEGLFVQLYPHKQVFLDRHEQFLKDDGQRYAVFELANCQNCGQEYLVGKRKESPFGDTLIHSGDMDRPEFYLIARDLDEGEIQFDSDDEIDERAHYNNKQDKFHLCLKCGRITPFAAACRNDCCEPADPAKIVTVVRIPFTGTGQDMNCCPCCGATRTGLIRRFLTANQPATFTIAKSLYDAIPPRPGKQSATPGSDAENLFAAFFASTAPTAVSPDVESETGRKLLVFSDNRQEAAFFAGYFDKKYHQVMWRRLILKCLRRAGSQGLSIDSLIDDVAQEARSASLYPAEIASDFYKQKKMATWYVMYEFLDMDANTGLEGLGYLKIQPTNHTIPVEHFPAFVPGLNSAECWHLLCYLMDTLRQKGACSFPEKGASPTDDFFSPRNHTYSFRQEKSETVQAETVLAFCPAEGRINKRSAFLQKLLVSMGCSSEEADKQAREILAMLMTKLVPMPGCNSLFTTLPPGRLGYRYQLNHHAWNISYLPEDATIYRCNRCGKITTYSVRNLCPDMKCHGNLEQVTAGQARWSVYYRRLLEDEKIIPMESREHTAQLSSQTAAEYQRDFEEGKINVLSCSTTFEMGVDVGELEATFLRNVPPETSNYVQRAGRAGRRTSSAAFSVTFARRRSHDMTFFQTPEKIIAGDIRVPSLEITNEKIAERHLNSIVIAWFFRKKRQYFDGNVAAIVSAADSTEPNMAQALQQELDSHPQDLLAEIHNALGAEICQVLEVDHWKMIDQLTGPSGTLTKAIQERANDINSLSAYQSNLDPSKQGEQQPYNNAGRLMKTLKEERSINFLSSHGVLPKYGFPVDSVNLNILYHDHELSGSIDLSRDLKIAISEFAPPAAVVANGRVWTSYAINTVPNQSWPTYIYYTCPKCRRIVPPNRGMVSVTFNTDEAELQSCPSCGETMQAHKFIIPQFGFSTKIDVAPKPVGDSRPKTYYATQTQFWGLEGRTECQLAEAREQQILFAQKPVSLIYSPGGQLFVLNRGSKNRGFLTCPECGFTTDPAQFNPRKGHRTKFNRPCHTKLEPVSLGHRFSTDILKITLPAHTVANPDYQDKDQASSVLYAILEGASAALDISRDDINGCVNYAADGTQELILFDDTPGGSGVSKQIYENFEQVVHEAIHQVSGICGCSPETSCYGCLRNYANQMVHEFLSRGLAYDYLTWLVETPARVVSHDTSVENGLDSNPFKGDVDTFQSQPSEDLSLRKKSHYSISTTDQLLDTVSALQECLDSCENVACIPSWENLIALARDQQSVPALLDSFIPVEGCTIWPAIFWPDARVALFETDDDSLRQYDTLCKYDWHCYILDQTMNINTVIEMIREER